MELLKRTLIFLAVCFLGLFVSLQLLSLINSKKIEQAINQKIQSLELQKDLKIDWEKVDFRFLPIKVVFHNLRLEGKSLNYIKVTKLKKLELYPNWLYLIQRGNIIKKIKISESDLELNLNPVLRKKLKSKKSKFQLPVKEFHFLKTNLKMSWNKKNFYLKKLNTKINFKKKHTTVQIKNGNISDNKNFDVHFSANSQFDLKFKNGFFKLAAKKGNLFKEKKLKLNIDINLKDAKLSFKKAKLSSQNTQLDLSKSYINLFSLQEYNLITKFNIKNIPSYINKISQLKNNKLSGGFLGQVNCFGSLKFKKSSCKLTSKISNLSLETKGRNFKLKPANLNLNFKYPEKTYSLILNQSSNTQFNLKGAQSTGNFEGFINISSIDSLFSEKLRGELQFVNGSFDFQKSKNLQSSLVLKNIQIGDYVLGKIKSQIKLKNKILKLMPIEGKFKNIFYSAKLIANYKKKVLNFYINIPFLDLKNISPLIARSQLKIKPRLKGNGKLKFQLKGPFDISKWKYSLNSEFFNILIDEEFFKKITLNLKSENNLLYIQNATAFKQNGFIKLIGYIKNNKNLNFNLTGHTLRLEDSQALRKFFKNHLSGDLNFVTNIQSSQSEFKTKSQINVKNIFINTKPFQNSKIKINIKNKNLTASGVLLGQKLQKIDYNHKKDLNLDIKFNKFNFINLLFIKNLENVKSRSELTGHLKVKTPFDNLRKLSGNFDIDLLKIISDSKSIYLSKKNKINFKSGQINLSKDLEFKGDKTNLKVTQNTKSININGKFTGALFSVFPFIESSSGFTKVNIDLNPLFYNLNPKGEIELNKSSIKFKNFSYKFLNLESKSYLKNSQIDISNISAKVAGGYLQGAGKMNFNKNFEMQINSFLQNIKLNFPKNIKSQGSGNLKFFAKNKKYGIIADYSVNRALIAKEFTKNYTKKSKFLVNKSTISPFSLDINIQLKKPGQVVNSTINSFFKGNLKIKGPVNQLKYSGNLVKVQKGFFAFREQEFDIISGAIKYQSVPISNPYLNIEGKTKFKEVQIKNGKETVQNFDIFLKIKGPAKNPSLKFNSNPNLSEKDIITILTIGNRKSELTKNNITAYSSYQLGSSLLERPFQRELQKNLGVDFKIFPIINKEEKKASTKVVLKKKISDSLNISASKTFDKNDEQNAKVEYNINENLSIIGFWESKTEELQENKENKKKHFGIDLEYKLDF